MDVVNSPTGGIEVPGSWPSEEAKERYIRFLELELRLMKNASEGTVDPDLLTAFNSLLDESFPRTKAYLEKKRQRCDGGRDADPACQRFYRGLGAGPHGIDLVPGRGLDRLGLPDADCRYEPE